MWVLSAFMIVIAVLIFLYSPKIEINPTILSFDESAVKSLDGIQLSKWNNVNLLFQGQVVGPESITHDPVTGNIFTGTHDGLVWKINKDLSHAEIVVRTGEDHPGCGSAEYSPVCGRVLGLKFMGGNTLIVADAYAGIIAIDVNSKTKEVLVGPDTHELTKSAKMFNSVDVSSDGVVYFTVSSTRWFLVDFIYSCMEVESTGSVYSYNIVTKQVKILASNLSFANGIVLSHDERSLLVAELRKRIIWRIDITDTTNIDVFADNLPGMPDNLKRGSHGVYYVGMPAIGASKLGSFVAEHPLINAWTAWLLPKWVLFSMFKLESLVLQLDEDGHIISAMDGEHEHISFITEAYEADGRIFLGSTISNHLAVVNKADTTLR